MSLVRKYSKAEATDNFLRLTAAGMAVVALIFFLEAAEFFAEEALLPVLDYALKGAALLVLIVGLPLFLRYKAIKLRARDEGGEPEAYIASIFKLAGTYAYSLTFVLMIAFKMLADGPLANIPSETLLSLLLGGSLSIFAIAFFVLRRDEADTGEEE